MRDIVITDDMIPIIGMIGLFIILASLGFLFRDKPLKKNLVDYKYDKLKKIMTLVYKNKTIHYYGFGRLWRDPKNSRRCVHKREMELYSLWQNIYYGNKKKV